MNVFDDNKPIGEHPVPHYYGDFVRECLMGSGVGLLLLVILDKELFQFYIVIGIVGVLAFTILAGMTSPKNRSVIFYIATISAIMFLLFEFFAMDHYQRFGQIFNTIFLLRQAMAILFIVILYFSTKTLRGTAPNK